MKKKGYEKLGNRTWEINHNLIQDAYFKLLDKNKKIPTYKLLCEETKLSEPTIIKHLEELNLDKLRPKFKPMIEQVIKRIGERAIATGKAPEGKLFLQVIADWKEKNETIVKLDESELASAVERRLGLK